MAVVDVSESKVFEVYSVGNIRGIAQVVSRGGSTGTSYLNKVYDSVAADVVVWITSAPDTSGASYPGPGVWGVNTSVFRSKAV